MEDAAAAAPTRQYHRLSLARDKIVFVDSKEAFDAFVEEISKAVITMVVGKNGGVIFFKKNIFRFSP